MAEETIYDAVADHLDRIDGPLNTAQTEMLKAYSESWRRINADLGKVIDQIKTAQDAGDEISQAWLYRQSRLETLRRTCATEMARYRAAVTELMPGLLADAAVNGAAMADALADLQLGEPPGGISSQWMHLPTDRVEAIVGAATHPGSPLSKLLQTIGLEAGDVIAQELAVGVAMGRNPNVIARACRQRVDGLSLSRSVTIARTEVMRAHRVATRATYLANEDVMDGWVWVSARDTTTCPACWAMTGTIHPLTERLDGHPRCRCAMAPKTKTWAEILGSPTDTTPDTRIDIEPGADTFAKLPPDARGAILGGTKGRLYEDGRLTLDDLVVQTDRGVWGTMRRESTLGEAIRNAETRTGRPFGAITSKAKRAPAKKAPARAKPRKPVLPAKGVKGTSVADGLDLTRAGAVKAPAERTLRAIGKVHGDGRLDHIPVVPERMTEQARFSWRTSGAAHNIEVDPTQRFQEFSIAHEIGHYLDHTAMGTPGKFSSETARRASPDYQAWKKWRSAIDGSDAFAMLKALPTGQTRRYALDRRELWARSYAQWITTRSKDPHMRAALDELTGRVGADWYVAWQWTDDDFVPIGAAIDDLMRELGWMV